MKAALLRGPVSAQPARPGRRGVSPRRHLVLFALLFLLAALCALLSLAVGAQAIAPAEVWRALTAPAGSDEHVIVRTLRVPRTLVGLSVGAALGLAGALIQGHTRNPIADPGLLGVGAGAAFGVVLSIFALNLRLPGGYVWFAFAGALAASVLVFVLGSTRRGSNTPVTLALAGAAVSALLGALTSALVLLDPVALNGFRFWAVGSLAGRGTDVLVPLLPFLLLGAVLALANSRALNSLGLGEDVARSLGLHVGRARIVGVASLTLLAGAAVAAAGPIAFLGLIVPHIARAATGPDHRTLLPASALLGGSVLLLADIVGRLVAPPGELQVGIVLAAVGAPFFIHLVRRRRLVGL